MITNEFEYIFLRCNLCIFLLVLFFLFDDLGIPCYITDTSSLLDWLANVFTNTLFYHKLWNLFLSIFTVIYGCIMKHSKPQKFKKKNHFILLITSLVKNWEGLQLGSSPDLRSNSQGSAAGGSISKMSSSLTLHLWFLGASSILYLISHPPGPLFMTLGFWQCSAFRVITLLT